MLETLPGESLFSLCARHHRMWGFASSASTCQALFGGARRGVHHDLPNALGDFANLTHGVYGTAPMLAKHQTLLSFYGPFLKAENLDAAAASMATSSVAHLKFRLGLLTGRFRAHHPLKACDDCMASDVECFGWTYWHIEHQYPGVWSCPRHGRPLRECMFKANGVERFHWRLPRSTDLLAADTSAQFAQESRQKLANLIVQLVQTKRPAGWLSLDATRLAIRRKLDELGWISEKGNLYTSQAGNRFQAYLWQLAGLPDLAHTQWNHGAVTNWIARISRPPRSGTHPLRWLLVIDWLFESAANFVDAYDEMSAEYPTLLPVPPTRIGSDEVGTSRQRDKSAVAERLRAGASARDVASEFGIDVGTVMAWGAAAGVAPSRRPKTFLAETRAAVISALQTGNSKAHVATTFNVTIQTVTRLLRTEPGLRATWQTAASRKLQLAHRAIWTGLLVEHPGIGRKLHRAMCPATFAWLYRNDREWLTAHSQALANRKVRQSPVRWDERDRALAELIHVAVRARDAQGKASHIKLWEIVQAVPELRAKLGSLNRLPLTQQALNSAVGRRSRQQHPDIFGN